MRKTNFDILRLALALGVFGIHWVHYKDLYGFVPCFVCLSGFLIPGSLASSTSPGHFVQKRLRRVIPAFTLSFVLVASLFGLKALPPTLLEYLSVGVVPVVGFNAVLWSLSLEELLYAFHVISRFLWSPRFAWSMFALSLTSWGVLNHLYHLNTAVHFGWPNNQLGPTSAFFAGNLLYIYKEKISLRGLMIAAAVIAPFILFHPKYWIPVDVAMVPVMDAFIVAALYILPQIKLRFADISYGIYVFHAPITQFLERYHANCAETLACVFAVAILSWYLVEKPVLSRTRSILLTPVYAFIERRKRRSTTSTMSIIDPTMTEAAPEAAD